MPSDEELAKDLTNALKAGEVPELYVSGFQLGNSTADVVLDLHRNGRRVMVLNMSFSLAKSLSQNLGSVISGIESQVGFEIKTTAQIEAALKLKPATK